MERVPYIVQSSRCFYAAFGIWLAIYLPLSMLSDPPGLLFVVSILTFGGAGATFMFWQAEAGRVIQEARAGEGDFSPRSVWWWVCPVLNLWMPLRGIVQLWEKSGAQREKWMLGVWWALWIGSLISQNLSFRLARFGIRGPGAEYMEIMGLAGLVLAGVFAVVVVARITNAARNLGRAATDD